MSENVQAAPKDSTPEEAPKTGAMDELVEIIKTVVYALAIALFLRVLFFQPFTIPSASMEPNLYEGDYIIVSKFSYGYSHHSIPFSPPLFSGRLLERPAHRGDVIVFKLPRDGHTDYIKRLIGLPGDRVQVKHGVIFINDKPIAQQPDGKVTMTSPYGLSGQVDRFKETFSNGKVHVGYSMDPSADIEMPLHRGRDRGAHDLAASALHHEEVASEYGRIVAEDVRARRAIEVTPEP